MDNTKAEPTRSESNKKFIVHSKNEETSKNKSEPSSNYIEAPIAYFKSSPEELSLFQGGGIR